jgi:flagellar hook-associated protein 3 FlgL
MRISTNQIYERGATNMMAQNEKAMKLSNQLSTGLRVSSPSDDPIAATQIELMNQRINSAQIYQKNNKEVTSNLNLEEGILGSQIERIQDLLALQIQSGNMIVSKENRETIANEAQSILDQLISDANSTGLTGEYIFGGSKANIPPINRSFDASTNSYVYRYNGDDKQRFQAISDSMQVATNDTGDNLFMNISAGNGSFSIKQIANPNNGTVVASGTKVSDPALYAPGNYTITISGNVVDITDSNNVSVYNAPYETGNTINFNGMSINLSGAPADGQTFAIESGKKDSLFSTVQRMINNLKAPFDSSADKAAIQTENHQIMLQLNNALSNVSNYRSDLGGRLNQLESVSTTTDNLTLISKEALKQLQEIDPISVATQYNLQLVNLQAAQQSFVRIQNLSVFNYIG